MDIANFINELDNLYNEKRLNNVEPFFCRSMEQAMKEEDYSAQFTILNEMMGFFRDTSQYKKSIKSCNDCLLLMKKMGIEGTVDYATSLQNIANAHRAAGMLRESLDYYNQAIRIYENNISANDYRYASINNNMALLYQEMGDFAMSVMHLEKALSIIEKIEDSEIEIATTYSNLGASLLELDRVEEAKEYLDKALCIFEKDKIKNFHYSAALCAMASVKCRQNKYEEAAPLYEEALKEIELNMGRGTAYKITEENLKKVYEKLQRDLYGLEDINEQFTGIQLAKKFYEEYGAPMIHEKFLEYENKIAVGFVGEGSERFGFDDVYSRDHDFGPGFCMWVTEDVYQAIGVRLQQEYDRLPLSYHGITRINTEMAQGRVGVCLINDFYKKYTGYEMPPKSADEWTEIDDYKLATVTNGVVFRDDEGIFTYVRNQFLKQPESARMVKLAREISAMAQTGQCNYGRSMARKDYVTAHICIAEFMQHTMKCLYIINGKYPPYYKWLRQGIKSLDRLRDIGVRLDELTKVADQRESWIDYTYDNTCINKNDKKELIIEEIAEMVINELIGQEIVSDINSNFLNDYVNLIIKKAYEMENVNKSFYDKISNKSNDDIAMENKTENEELVRQESENRDEVINDIVHLEFDAFDKVQNVGGRAECQNNWPFFYVMRKSQYMTWTDEMLITIRDLWRKHTADGWNFITEKYGRMMEYTSPMEYNQIKDNFPQRSERTIAIVNQIAEIQVGWMKGFAEKYPKLAANARDITSDADDIYNTSYETYLKGELLTYSEELLKMYAEFIVHLAQEGKNLAYMTIENTAHLQGYKSLDEAEKNSN